MNHRVTDKEIGSAILEMLESREITSSICPSEVARLLSPENGAWRSLMPDIRRVAQGLAAIGVLRVTRGSSDVDALAPGGPIRLRRPGG